MGYASTSLDELGDDGLFRKIRQRLGITAFGVTAFEPPEDRTPTVLADVLVGGDGLARAVRFVRVVRSNQRQEQP